MRIRKRIGALTLVLCLLLGMIPTYAGAATVASGACGAEGDGSNLTWVFDDAGTLTISGSGAMADYTFDDSTQSVNAPWFDRRDNIATVVLENGVTTIGNEAFAQCAVSGVSLPDSVISIGNSAFSGCPLASVSFPSQLAKIGNQAFYVTSLSSVTIPASVTEIGVGAFSGCYNLSAITVASGNGAYLSDDGILFDSSKTTLINYPGGKTGATYSVPEGVTTIALGAFEGSQNLTGVTIPNGVEIIEEQAFYDCLRLQNVTIPVSVTEILTGAFMSNVHSNAFTDVYYQGTETQWNAITIEEDNDLLTSATIHYNSAGSSGGSGGATTTLASVSVTNSRATAYDASGAAITSGITWSVTPENSGVTISNEGRLTVSTTATAQEYTVTATPDPSGTIAGSAKSAAFTVTRSYTITFAPGDGGTGSMSAVTTDAVSYTLPANGFTAPSGMRFKAWSVNNAEYAPGRSIDLDTDTTLKNTSDGVELSGAMTLTALWEQDTTVTLDHVALNPASVTLDGTSGASVTATAYDTNDTKITEGINWELDSPGNNAPLGFDTLNGEALITIPADALAGDYTVTARPDSFGTVTGSAPPVTLTVARNSDSDIIAQGYCGSGGDGTNLSWVLKTDGTLTISGSGAMTNYGFDSNFAPWYEYRDRITSIVIESGVTSLGSYAFHACAAVTSVSLPDNMTSLTYGAFANCSALESVTIPAGVTSLGNGVFNGCSALKEVTIPAGVTVIGTSAFGDCVSLTALHVESGNARFRDDNGIVFTADGSKLVCYPAGRTASTYAIPSNVTSLDDGAFDGCVYLTSVTIPAGMTSVSNQAFYHCAALTSVTIPVGVTTIGRGSFEGCSALPTVTLPDGLTTIGNSAFYECAALKSVRIPASVTSVVNYAFDFCSALTDVYYGGAKAQWETLKGNIGGNNDPLLNATIHCTDGDIVNGQSVTTYTITFAPNGGAGTMNPVTVTDNAYTLPQNGFTPPNGMRFRKWSVNNAEYTPGDTISLSADVTVTALWETDTSDILASGYCGGEGDGTNLSWVLKTDGTLTISGSGAMAVYDISASNAPWYENRDSIITVLMERGATTIGNYAFRSCEKMTSVSIPDSVTSIGEDAFWSCSGLTSVSIPNSVTSIGNSAFAHCSGLTSVSIPNSVTSIGGGAFYACGGLTSVSIPNSVTSIGSSAFALCSGLTSVSIPNSVTSIGSYAFESCSGLTSVSIPDSVTSIGDDVFCHCTGLTEITVAPENSAYRSENGILFNKDKTQLIRYPSGRSGTTYVVPEGVTSLARDVFCASRLSAIHIPASVGSIAGNTFYECDDLTDIYYGGTETQWNAISDTGFRSDISRVTMHYNSYNGETLSDIIGRGECGAGLTWILTRDGALTISGSGAMSDYSVSAPAPWYAQRQNVKTVIMQSGVSSIGAYAFRDCGALADVTIPNSLTSVTPHAFDECNALERVSFGGTPEQWDHVIFTTSDNDALEFAEVDCGGTAYNAYRYLEPLGKTDSFADREWKFPAPLNRFRNLYIDVEDAESAEDNHAAGALTSIAPGDLESSRQEGMKGYVAEDGSTKLTIPKETFETFEEGSHKITATFQTKPNPRDANDTGLRQTSEVYTVFPSGPIVIDDSELARDDAKAVQDVSYTARLQTAPKLSDRFYKFEIVSAQRDDQELTVTTMPNPERIDENAPQIQKLGDQDFFFHPNGRFTGVPSIPGEYTLTVKLQVRREANTNDWYEPDQDDSHTNPMTVKIRVEGKTPQNVTKTSPGYTVIQEPPVMVEQGTRFSMIFSMDDPNDELDTVRLDGILLQPGSDYLILRRDEQDAQWVIMENVENTQRMIQILKTDVDLGFHGLDLQLKHKDVLDNTETKSISRPVTVTQRQAAPVVNRVSSGGGGGSSSGSGTTYYSVKISNPSHGTISLSAKSAAYNKTVTITVTPDNGYRIKSVSAVDGKSNTVTLNRNGNKYTFRMPKQTVTVSATFERSVYDVGASAAQHGKITLNSSSAAPGATVNGSTTPDKGYVLSGVTVRDADGKSVKVDAFNDGKFTFLMPTGKATVSATFTVKRLASFVDIQGPDWFFDDAEWAYHKNILRGTTEQYWEPQSLMSSVTSIVTLERLDGVDLTPYDTGADDGIDNSQWYASAQRWARDNNILLKDRPFGERDAMTRGECAVMLTNFLRYRGLNVTPTNEASFTDAADMTQDELNAFRLLQDANVFRGYSDGSIRPKNYLSRAHLSALLHRLSEYIIKTETDGII